MTLLVACLSMCLNPVVLPVCTAWKAQLASVLLQYNLAVLLLVLFRFYRKLLFLTSDQTRLPAEFKHINKRRKRN